MLGRNSLALAAVTVALAGCATARTPAIDPLAAATLVTADGEARGGATLTATDGKLKLTIDAKGLPPGVHGAHLHAVGRCDAPGFTSAGPHLNPHGKLHGSENPQGSHLGDLPNLTAGANGVGTVTVELAGTQAELEQQLFDSDGTAVVIHATADDYRTDPSGNSGGRIACGLLKRG